VKIGAEMYTANWIFDIAVMRTAYEFLSSEVGIEAFGKKYSEGLGKLYSQPIAPEMLFEPAQSILEFLSEIEAGEEAVELINNFTYFRLYNEGINKPRKMKSMFGTIEDPVKTQDYKAENTIKAFRAYVFGLRSNTVPIAPEGWRLENDDHIDKLKPLIEASVSVLDMF
jgi:hypothetical protein